LSEIMLSKIFVLCALVLCALGDKITPPPLDCAFHVTTQGAGSYIILEKYGFQTGNDIILMEESYEVSKLPRKDYSLYRSDMKNADGEIFFMGFGGNDTLKPKYCQDDWIDIAGAFYEIAPFTAEFEYEGEGVSAPCPDTSSTGCMKYCNANKECVIVDSDNRYVQLADGTTVEYKKIVHDVNDFVTINCSTGALYEPPVNPCGAQSSSSHASSSHGSGKITPPELGCAFHVTFSGSDSFTVVEKYGFRTADTVILTTESYDPNELPRKEINLFRSDMKNADGEILFTGISGEDPKQPKSCQQEYVEIEVPLSLIASITEEFEYEGEGVSAPCPNASYTGCMKYCNANKECVIVDSDNRYVQFTDGTIAEYRNIVHDVNDFVTINCSTGDLFEPPVNPCGAQSSSSHASSSHGSGKITPPELDCAFHITMNPVSGLSSVVEEYGFQTSNDIILMEERYNPGAASKDYSLYRSDMKDADGDILFTGFGGDPKQPKSCQQEYIPIEYVFGNMLAPFIAEFEYEGEGVSAPCPNTSYTGCMKYCNANKECVIFDSDNRYVQFTDGTTVEYKKIVHDVNDFVTINCSTGDLFEPPVNPCGSQSSSSHASSSHASSSHASSSHASSSHASSSHGSGKITPPELDCSFHVSITYPGSYNIHEEYGFRTADTIIVMEESYDPSELPRKDYNLFRSDMKDADGEILFTGFGGNDTKLPKYCQQEYVPIQIALNEIAVFTAEFEYEGEGDIAPCPNATYTGCMKYCNANKECVIVDSKNRYVQLVDGTILDYKKIVHNVNDFVAINCSSGELFEPPVNPCGSQSSSGHHQSSDAASFKTAASVAVFALLALLL